MTRPILLATATVSLWGLAGCASLPGPEAPPSLAETRVEDIPADRSAEFDFLAGRELELSGRGEDALVLYGRALEKDPDSAYLHRRYAELAARQGLIEEALEHGRRAHDLAPDDTDTRVLVGTLYRVAKDAAGAEAVLLGADGLPVTPESGMLLFSVYLDVKRYDDALRIANWLVEREPGGLRGYFALAGAYERLERLDDVEKVLRDALEVHPGNVAIYGALARLRREQGDHEGEIAIYREVLVATPDHHPTLVALAEAQQTAGRVDEARATLVEIERRFPDDLRSTIRLALLDFESQRYAEAAERFERAFQSNPEQYELAYFLGLVYQRAEDEERALQAFLGIPEGHERFAEARTQAAAIYEGRHDYASALVQVEAARASEPSRPLDLYRASLRAKSGDFDGAVRFLEDLLAETPEDDELLYNLGVLYGERRLYDEALSYMRSAVEKNPQNASALNYIGYTYADQGRNLDEAERLIVRALELRPEDGFITDSLAWVYYMRARPLVESGNVAAGHELLKRALEELDRAVELTGGDPVISEHLGDVYLLLDDKEQALEYFEEAARLEPRDGEQPDLFQKLEQLRNELRAP